MRRAAALLVPGLVLSAVAACTASSAPDTEPVGIAGTQPVAPSAVAFQLAPPSQPVIGGITIGRPACRPSEIAASATTRTAAYGVLGVVHLRGTRFYRRPPSGRLRCALHMPSGPARLIGADGDALPVRRSSGDTVSPPANPRSDIPLTDGRATWGFSWLGSYCGPRAIAVELPLRGFHRALRVTLTGPSPRCSGRSSSVLVDGVTGAPGDPVQPPAPAFRDLRLHLHVQPGTTRKRLGDIDATLTTVSGLVLLSPCPEYAGRVTGTAPNGGFGDPVTPAFLDCRRRPSAVTSGEPVHFTIPGPSLTFASHRGAVGGSEVRVDVGIAGVPTASVTVRVP